MINDAPSIDSMLAEVSPTVGPHAARQPGSSFLDGFIGRSRRLDPTALDQGGTEGGAADAAVRNWEVHEGDGVTHQPRFAGSDPALAAS